MKPEQLAKDIERLQKLDNGQGIPHPQGVELIARDALRALNYPNAMRTINSLIDLVAMQHEALENYARTELNDAVLEPYSGFNPSAKAKQTLIQSTPIAALARKETS